MNALFLSLLFAVHALERQGVDHLYNLDFEGAYQIFDRLRLEEPTSPAGPYYLASTLWMEELTRRGGMAGETFQSSRYWSRTREEAPSPAVTKRFETYASEAVRRAQAILEDDAQDVEGLYFLGATEGVMSAFEATIRRKFFAAYRLGRRARGRHQKLMERDPPFADAYLLPGIYEYAMATLPRSVRFLGFLIGIRGSKQEGARLLLKAAREGTRAYWPARLALVVLETREKRYHRALAYLRELEAAFPNNPLFPAERGWVYLLRKDWTSARGVFQQIEKKQRLQIPYYHRIPAAIVLLRWGESLLFDGRFDDALEHFDRALTQPDAADTTRAMLHLRRGQAFDGLDRRREARGEYQMTVRLDADRPSRRQAKRYLKEPFQLSR